MTPIQEKLRQAARQGLPHEVLWLMSQTDPNARDDKGMTALMWAAERGRAECARILISRSRAKARCNKGLDALMRAAASGHARCAQSLLPFCDPRARTPSGWTALMFAASQGHEQCVAALLPASESLARTRSRKGHGLSALMLASHGGHSGCARLLIPASDLDAADDAGRTALDIAMEQSQLDCVELLARAMAERAGEPDAARYAEAMALPLRARCLRSERSAGFIEAWIRTSTERRELASASQDGRASGKSRGRL